MTVHTTSRGRWQRAWVWLRELGLDMLALVWPTACVACGLQDRELCAPCAAAVREAPRARPEYLGSNLPCYVAGPYDGAVREVLLAYKHGGAHGFVRPLGARLGGVLRTACAENLPRQDAGARAGPPHIVTIPSRPARVRSRGYRHVEDLVRVAVRHERLPMRHVRALRVLRGRTGQVGLGAEARERNARRIAVRGSAKNLRGAQVILVDDIVTTGATIRAACDVLERAGARVIAVVALCSAVRRDTPEKTQVEAHR